MIAWYVIWYKTNANRNKSIRDIEQELSNVMIVLDSVSRDSEETRRELEALKETYVTRGTDYGERLRTTGTDGLETP